ncbi:hypothetical protein Rhopal_006565-T1 [Rhodotorula paludigena]|uniref:Uncharacterized protein n=1 Tax=Rhodotorula paludigena TaxID=86838 RepID=A0AAV5GTG8_9BASI|nr:hypothetical protein Rhopal_006565-T1 [Rhodotorula paludigena]
MISRPPSPSAPQLPLEDLLPLVLPHIAPLTALTPAYRTRQSALAATAALNEVVRVDSEAVSKMVVDAFGRAPHCRRVKVLLVIGFKADLRRLVLYNVEVTTGGGDYTMPRLTDLTTVECGGDGPDELLKPETTPSLSVRADIASSWTLTPARLDDFLQTCKEKRITVVWYDDADGSPDAMLPPRCEFREIARRLKKAARRD